MCLKSLFLLLSLTGTLSSAKFCISETPCKCIMAGGQAIDLSSVGLAEFPRFYEILANNSQDLYSYNPCYPFDSTDKQVTLEKGNKPCIGAAACLRTPGGNSGERPEEHVLGVQRTAVFGRISELGLHINYTVEGAAQSLTVKLLCDNSTKYTLVINTPETADNKHVVMTLNSLCACPNGCSAVTPDEANSGLSTGSKLLIAFFTILIAYFLVGIVWNFCNGAQGLELVPNLDFWNDLPKLIIEGVSFSCSCCGRNNSYGEV